MDVDAWLTDYLPKYSRITESVISITKSLLEANSIDYLSITGRTKDKKSIIEKIERKSYRDARSQMMDISGVRIILFIESDVYRVCSLINEGFNVDVENSSNKDESLSSNEVGYRSVHFVCDIGGKRAELPEFNGLSSLKFEFQIRTVLQHAWAELAHDRSYKFRKALPNEIQRKLYLHAGLLEIADKGFSEIAREIDNYSDKVADQYKSGDLEVPINSISIYEFAESWAENNDITLESVNNRVDINDLIKELQYFDIKTIKQLNEIIPDNYAKEFKKLELETNIFGLIRDWMIIKDINTLKKKANVKWMLYDPEADELELYRKLSSEKNYDDIIRYVSHENSDFNGEDYVEDD